MKKLKLIVPVLLAAVMLLTIPFSAACKKKNDKVTTELQSITLNTDNVKTDYYTGQNFDSLNLIVTATFKKSDQKDTYTEDVSESAVIDSSAFKKNAIGTYAINVSYTYEEQTKSASYNVKVSEASLTVDTAAVKTRYLTGETLDKTGLKVYSNILAPGATEPTVTEVTSSASVNWNAVDLTKEGEYTVSVTARIGGSNLNASFTVSVITPRNGLDVQLAEGVESVINLTADNPTASINPDAIVVKQSDAFGILGDTPLTAAQYDVKVFNKQEEVTDFTALKGGVYQIWASLKENPEIEGFALIYVNNEIVDIEFTGGDVKQMAGSVDNITPTWTYLATYVNGDTKVVKASEVTVENFNPKTVGKNTATVNYTDANAQGVEKTVSTTVDYEITSAEGAIEYSFSYSELQATILAALKAADSTVTAVPDKTGLKQEYFNSASNRFIGLIGTLDKNDQYRSSNGCFEVKGEKIALTFLGTGTLTVGFASTGGKNESRLAVIDSEGNILTANVGGTTANKVDGEEGVYTVTGTSYATVTYTITEPGVYKITTTPGSFTSRGARINQIDMVDVVEGSEVPPTSDTVVQSVNFSNVATVDVIAAGTELAIVTKDNVSTGFTYIATKDAKIKNSSKDGYTTRLESGGTTSETGGNNSFKFTVGAGTTTIEVVYNQTKDGRYCNLFKGVGDGYELVANSLDNATVLAGDMKTHTFTITCTEETTLYLGSATGGGLYFWEITATTKAE